MKGSVVSGQLLVGPRRPALRYHGGKWLLAPWIISHFPAHRIYVEPFGGGASVLLRKERSYAEVYNDLDGEVVNLFRVLRGESGEDLCRRIELTPFAREEFDGSYEGTECEIERARRLVSRSFMGFGSGSYNADYVTGFRAYSKETGRTPSRDWDGMPDALRAVAERFKGVTIECRDALQVIHQQDTEEALFYVDPPYPQGTRPNSNHRQYRHEMSPLDHSVLCQALLKVKGKVVISSYANALYDGVFASWHRVEREAFGGGNKGRVARVEVLWMNFSPSKL